MDPDHDAFIRFDSKKLRGSGPITQRCIDHILARFNAPTLCEGTKCLQPMGMDALLAVAYPSATGRVNAP